jgi:hypothetical protein
MGSSFHGWLTASIQTVRQTITSGFPHKFTRLEKYGNITQDKLRDLKSSQNDNKNATASLPPLIQEVMNVVGQSLRVRGGPTTAAVDIIRELH